LHWHCCCLSSCILLQHAERQCTKIDPFLLWTWSCEKLYSRAPFEVCRPHESIKQWLLAKKNPYSQTKYTWSHHNAIILAIFNQKIRKVPSSLSGSTTAGLITASTTWKQRERKKAEGAWKSCQSWPNTPDASYS
jgi:hypothetical protein